MTLLGSCAATEVGAVDLALTENLQRIVLDFDELLAGQKQTREMRMTRATAEVEQAEEAKAKLIGTIERVQAKYAEKLGAGDDESAEAVLEVLKAERAKLDPADERIRAARSEVEALSAEQSLDPMLDLMNDLRAVLRGDVERAGGDAALLAEVVRSNFQSVYLRHLDDGSIEIAPVLAREAVERILGPEWTRQREALGEAPTVEELDAMPADEAEGRIAAWESIVTDHYLSVAVPPPLRAANAPQVLFCA